MNNIRFLQALKRQTVDCTPVWLMRQAGRYLPEYRALRQRAGSFLALAKNPELACEVSLQPLQRFPLDAAIIFSDILMIPDAMGLELDFRQGEGPFFRRPILQPRDVDNLSIPCPADDLGYVLESIRLLKQEADVPVIGFCGSPWTIAAYMVEPGPGKPLTKLQALLRDDADTCLRLLDKLAKAVSLHLQAQIEAGADCVMLFDTWGRLLSAEDYHRYALPTIKLIVDDLQATHPDVPRIVFAKSCEHAYPALADSGWTGLGLDETTDLQQARLDYGDKVALQGNLSPKALLLDEHELVSEVKRVLAAFGDNPGHIFNLGHGVTPDIDPAKVALLIDVVHEETKQ